MSRAGKEISKTIESVGCRVFFGLVWIKVSVDSHGHA